ncbi:MAG: VWA domain-containing protein [Actinomycetota bacterium]|nr:VWA domain-containing protein [Actinomycetota bacterium]
MLERLSSFVEMLRGAGVPVSIGEKLDAISAVEACGLWSRQDLRACLAATLVKDRRYWDAFNLLFDLFFPSGALRPTTAEGDFPQDVTLEEAVGGDGDHQPLSSEDLADVLRCYGEDGERSLLRSAAAAAVSRHAGIEPGRPVGPNYYVYRTLRAIDPQGVLSKLLASAQDTVGDGRSTITTRLERRQAEQWVADLEVEVRAEITRRLAAEKGVEAMVAMTRRPLPQDVDFTSATTEDLAALRRALDPLALRLAARLGRRRRRRRRGAVDFRSTFRHSLSYGGAPVDLRFRRPALTKPELWVLADVSGSVAAFARFTLQLLYAIDSQFSTVRSFVFVDGLDEVTSVFASSSDIDEALARIDTEADVIWQHGHSDYGHALTVFSERWADQMSPRSTVVVLGDARNNYHSAGTVALARVAAAAREVFWLNPEPRSYWDTGDSIASSYAPYCDGVFECRNLRQLEAFADHLALRG